MTGMDERLAKVAEVLAGHAWQAAYGGCYGPCDWHGDDAEDEQERHAEHVAQALTPLLAGFTAQDEARALREAARDYLTGSYYEHFRRWLRDRAAALDAGRTE